MREHPGGMRQSSFAYLIVALLAAPALPSGVLAACIGPGVSKAACSAELSSRLDGILVVDPSDGRTEKRLAGTPWLAAVWEAAPVAAVPEPSESSFRMQTSVGQWGAWSAKAMNLRMEEARKLAPEGFRLPRAAPRPDPNLDVWASVAGRGIGEETSREIGSKVGADYRIGRAALVGVAVATGDRSEPTGAASEGSYTVASYFALKPLPLLTFETRAGFGESRAGELDRTSDIAHRFVVAQLRSDFLVSQLKISPTLALAHGDDTLKNTPTGATGALDTLTFGPRISRPFALGGGQRLEPFVKAERKLDLGQPAITAPDVPGAPSRSELKLGAGLELVKPNAYSLRVTTDVEEKDNAAAPPNVRGRFELKVPIR